MLSGHRGRPIRGRIRKRKRRKIIKRRIGIRRRKRKKRKKKKKNKKNKKEEKQKNWKKLKKMKKKRKNLEAYL